MLTPMQNQGRYRPIPRSLIRRFVRRIAERFQPEKVILFGSYAYGHPTNDSDVDLLVIMDTPSREVDQAVEIRLALDAPFPLDLMVRRPRTIEQRIALGDYFLREITKRGKVLYERPHPTVDSQGRRRLSSHAVEARYPGLWATRADAEAAFQTAADFRRVARKILVPPKPPRLSRMK